MPIDTHQESSRPPIEIGSYGLPVVKGVFLYEVPGIDSDMDSKT